MRYPVNIAPDDRLYLATFPDIPEAISRGESRDEALHAAADALNTAFAIYFDERYPIPMPSQIKRGQSFVELTTGVATKVLVFNETIRQSSMTEYETQALKPVLDDTGEVDDYWKWMQKHRGTISPDLDLEF